MRAAIVLTAIPVETRHVLAHLSDLDEEVVRGTVFHVGTFTGPSGPWRVAVAELGAGNIGAAVAVERATTRFAPDVALFVGVAGAIKDAAVGDVVIGTKVYGYEAGKVEDGGFRSRPNLGRSSESLVSRARAVGRGDGWRARLRYRLPHDTRTVHIGPIAAGEKVVASVESDLYRFLRTHYNDALAIEMEGYGFLEALAIGEEVRGLVVRGVSDLLAGKAASDAQHGQDIASDSAAAVAFEILACLDPPSDGTGGGGGRPSGSAGIPGTGHRTECASAAAFSGPAVPDHTQPRMGPHGVHSRCTAAGADVTT